MNAICKANMYLNLVFKFRTIAIIKTINMWKFVYSRYSVLMMIIEHVICK